MKKIITLAALLSLSACSLFGSKGDSVIFDKVLGPQTGVQIQPLPSDLRGDKANQTLSGETLKGKGLEKDGQ